MGAINIRRLEDWHSGSDIYILCSGASFSAIPASFWENKIVIAVNEMFRHYAGYDFVISHHTEHAQEAIDLDVHRSRPRFVTSDRAYDFARWGHLADFMGEYYTYRTTGYEMSLEPTIDIEHVKNRKDDELVVSACTTAEALQFAQHLGAANIILCGADGGTIDGRLNVADYNVSPDNGKPACTNPQHIRLTEPIIEAVANVIRSQGTPVLSLNPFINFGLEGHEYKRPPVLKGTFLVQALNTVQTR